MHYVYDIFMKQIFFKLSFFKSADNIDEIYDLCADLLHIITSIYLSPYNTKHEILMRY